MSLFDEILRILFFHDYKTFELCRMYSVEVAMLLVF